MKDDLVSSGDEGRGKRRYFLGELQTSFEPRDSEFGNELWVISKYPNMNKIVLGSKTRGSETSQYPEEKKAKRFPE